MSDHSPIFRSIFGSAWEEMPPVFHKHYANRPFSRDSVIVEGLMTVEMSWLTRCVAPLLRLTGTLAPIAGRDIPVTVTFRSEVGGAAFCYDREFRYPGRKPYHFRSVMIPIGGGEVIEWLAIGLGWRAAFSFQDNKVRLEHRGYAVRLFGMIMRAPLEFLLGRAHAQEQAIDDSAFRMEMIIRHRVFGTLYGYSGVFQIREMRLDR